MIDPDKKLKILDLTIKLAKNYIKNNKVGQKELFKKKIINFLTDPMWDDKLIFQLKQEIEDLEKTDENFESLIEEVERVLEDAFEDNRKKNTYLFEGKIREYEMKLIDIFTRIGKLRGQSYALATIIGALLIHRKRGLTQEQIRDLTGLSKGAISTNLKIIEKSPLVKKELIKGTRTHLYTFGGDLTSLASNTSLYKKETNLVARDFLLQKTTDLKTLKNKKGYEILSKRVEDILKFLEFHNGLIELIKEFEFINGSGSNLT